MRLSFHRLTVKFQEHAHRVIPEEKHDDFNNDW